jgi:ferritin-like metal-binding protein YciE
MKEPRELFMHELGDILYAERTLVKTLPKLAEEATDKSLATAFEDHLTETKQHVANVEAAFEAIGEKPKAEKCPGIEGLKTEHDEFVKDEDPSPDVLDMFLTGAGARTEHYEIAAYTGLVTMADALGEKDAAKLLRANREQETAALDKLTTISKTLGRKVPATA